MGLGHKALFSQLADFLADVLSEFRIPGLLHQVSNIKINILIKIFLFELFLTPTIWQEKPISQIRFPGCHDPFFDGNRQDSYPS